MPEISIISYLHYLHDISRKILQRGGFENVLFNKTKRQHPYYFDFDHGNDLSKYLRGRNLFLQAQAGKGLFLGLGLITGKIQTKTRKRNLAAPLLFVTVELIADEEDATKVDYEVIWDTINLNYDLITLILEHASYDESEEAEDMLPNFFVPGQKVDPEKLKILTDIDSELDRNLDNEKYQSEILRGGKIADFMTRIATNIPDFRIVVSSPSPFEHAHLRDYIDAERLTFFDHRFFFVAPVADELSTTVALRELIRQTE